MNFLASNQVSLDSSVSRASGTDCFLLSVWVQIPDTPKCFCFFLCWSWVNWIPKLFILVHFGLFILHVIYYWINPFVFFLLDQRIPGSNPQWSKYTNFKAQKHHDSQELTIPDFNHLSSYFMEKILAYTNPAHRNTLKMSFYCDETKLFGVKLQNVSFFTFR